MSDMQDEGIDPSVNEIPAFEQLTAEDEEIAARKAKKAAKKKPHAEGDEGLNIVALMDAFTIILVFLIKSYQSDPTSITQDDNITLPQSTSQLLIVEAVPVVVTKKGILVADQAVVRLNADGKVDATDKQGFSVPRVAEALKKEAEKQKMIARFNSKVKFEGIVLIVADKGTKFQTLTDVLYSAGQVEFGKFKFAVLRQD